MGTLSAESVGGDRNSVAGVVVRPFCVFPQVNRIVGFRAIHSALPGNRSAGRGCECALPDASRGYSAYGDNIFCYILVGPCLSASDACPLALHNHWPDMCLALRSLFVMERRFLYDAFAIQITFQMTSALQHIADASMSVGPDAPFVESEDSSPIVTVCRSVDRRGLSSPSPEAFANETGYVANFEAISQDDEDPPVANAIQYIWTFRISPGCGWIPPPANPQWARGQVLSG